MEEQEEVNDVDFDEPEASFQDATTNTEIKRNKNVSTHTDAEVKSNNRKSKRKLTTDQSLDKALGLGSSKEKYRKNNGDSSINLRSDNLEDTPNKPILKRKLTTDQALDKALGLGSSKEKYRKNNGDSLDLGSDNLEDNTHRPILKRKLTTNQSLDKVLGLGSSKDKYRKYNNDSPTDIVNSDLWDRIENTPEPKPWEVALPDDDSDSEE